jgi:hypothetical protein
MSTRFLHEPRLYVLAALLAATVPLTSCGKPQESASPEGTAAPVAQVELEPRFMKPEHVKGLYLTAWSAGSKRKLDKVLPFLKRNGLNAVVVDIRDAGKVYVKTGIEMADKSGATAVAIRHPDKLMDRLQKEGVYPIARIACFRDSFVPVKRPDRAIVTPTGALWKDRSGYPWLDPYNKKNWEYLGDIVDFALELGFPEIQLDYVRFPSEGKTSTAVFPSKKNYPDAKATPTEVVAAFANYIGERVKKKKAAFSADVFGIVSSGKSDQGIGQELETIAAPFDLLCPMVYPSHFAKGEYGIGDPNSAPYHIVQKSLKDYAKRLPNKPIRPWLQDFSLGVKYGAKEVKAQVKAAKDAGFQEFLLWNAGNNYSEGIAAIPPKKGK